MKSVSKINISEKNRTAIYMKLLVLIILMCGSASIAQADYFNLAWGIQYGTAANEDAVYDDIQADSMGNIYTMWGSYDGSTTTTNMTKLNPTGNIFWTKSEQRNYIETPCRLKMDSQNNYCIFGYTNGPSGGSYYGGSDGFVRKYNSDGQLLWARQQGTSGNDNTRNGTFDSQNNIYVIGEFSGLGVTITKYDQNGNYQWQKYHDIYSNGVMGVDIRVSSTGEIYLALGYGFYNPNNAQAAIIKLDQNGNMLWHREFGVAGVEETAPFFIGFDSQGRIDFIVGTNGALGGSHYGSCDIALGRCDANGNIQWLGQYGTSAYDGGYNSLIGPADCVIIVGFTAGSFFNTTHGGYDAYIMQIAADGNLMGGSQFGTSGTDVFFGLCSNGTDYYICGHSNDSLWGPSAGGVDIILGKLNLTPTNDEKVDAIQVEVNDIISGWTVGATGTDITLNGYNDSNDVWYYFEPNESGKYTIQVYNATFDTTLAVFDANNKEIVFNDDFWGEKSVVILKAKAGKRYYIRVAGYDEETGDFTMSVEQGAIQAIQGDLNYDGNVDLEDFAAFAQNWMMGE